MSEIYSKMATENELFFLRGIKKIFLLSRSPVKIKAIHRWLNILKKPEIEICCVDSMPTDCPQPVGSASAIKCLEKRFPPMLCEDKDTIYVGIENFIQEKKDGWHDDVAVALVLWREDQKFMHVQFGLFGNRIPKKFAPKAKPNIENPCGFTTTVGQRIYASNPKIPHDNWATFVGQDCNIDRQTQIVDALRRLNIKFLV